MFQYHAGTAPIPSNATLALMTVAGPTPVSPGCTTTISPSNLTLTPGIQTGAALNDVNTLAPGLHWGCEFTVAVGDQHKALGKINAFSVQLVFAGSASSKAFYVAALNMPAVYVYTGGVLDIGSAVLVDTTGAPGAPFYASK